MAVHPVHGYAVPPPQDVKVGRRNARERNRVMHVNSGFEVLKRHIPAAAPIKKMSKVHILSHAVEYITNLQALLNDSSSSLLSPSSGVSSPPMTCPTSLQEKAPHLISYPQHHRYSPRPSGYSPSSPPPPLTPLSPNVPYYPSANYTYCPNYESGYETSGFYSETETPMLTSSSWRPVHPSEQPPQWIVQEERKFKQECSIHEAEPISPAISSLSESSTSHYSLPSRPVVIKKDPETSSAIIKKNLDSNSAIFKQNLDSNSEHYSAIVKQNLDSNSAHYSLPPRAVRTRQDPESSGEEDDILDAIEEWQRE